ncbi:MAG: hypothetical protein HC880_01045 [Bacteroidia bacterium]|nr:hypothetical protein [Bacteroidia bacterium]
MINKFGCSDQVDARRDAPWALVRYDLLTGRQVSQIELTDLQSQPAILLSQGQVYCLGTTRQGEKRIQCFNLTTGRHAGNNGSPLM